MKLFCVFRRNPPPWVAEQIWHPDQKTSTKPDGSLLLKFSVADFREFTQKILSHGSDVKVVSPPKLKNLIKKEIEKITKIYQDYNTV